MTIPTDDLRARELRALSAHAAVDAKRTVEEALRLSHAPASDRDAANRLLERMMYQDRPLSSWRVWAVVWGVASAVLAVPEVQMILTAAVAGAVPVAWAPVATAALSAALAAVSKRRDPRPERGPQ